MEGSIVPEARSRAQNPENQLLAIFDVYDLWFRDDNFEACSFVQVLLEMGPGQHLGRQVSVSAASTTSSAVMCATATSCRTGLPCSTAAAIAG